MKPESIAPCGMNCRLCWGFVREKNRCPGCRKLDSMKPRTRTGCVIRRCDEIAGGRLKYCSPKCSKYPCHRLKLLDKRYRTRYGMSMLENLAIIDERGIRKFVALEKARRACPGCGGVICVHRPACIHCGRERD